MAVIARADRRGLLLACVCLTGLVCGCTLPGKPRPEDRPVPANRVLQFGILFRTYCAGCHGADGQHGPAPALNDPLFRSLVPQEELEEVLLMGRPGTPMPAFAREGGGVLTSEQVQVLVHEIKGIPYRVVEKNDDGRVKREVVADKWGIIPEWGAVGPAPASAPPYTLPEEPGSAAVDAGAKVFARACVSCHGENGQGITKGEQRLNRINDGVFLALISDQALRRYVITGRPDFGMPNYAQTAGRTDKFQPLTAQEVTDLGSLFASWRRAGARQPGK